jgi:uncharacterized coiled-coil protein SlyX
MKYRNTTFLSVLLMIGSFALLRFAQAVVPPPDGGYPGGNTAEGQNALFSLTTGTYNTAVGLVALRSNTEGSFNTAIGAGTLFANTGNLNTATGAGALLSNITGFKNTANGAFALFSNTTGVANTANGAQALTSNTTGGGNTANGDEALYSNATGDSNTANGRRALNNNTTGSSNIALGINAGYNLTTGDNNIDIGNGGVAGESSTIRIGSASQTRTFIAGIFGVTNMGSPVLIDPDGQLGTATSSRRFKHEIKAMDKASEAILALKPVTFHYKSDASGTPQFGLIAEEVAEVDSDLVVRDGKGEIYTVRYDAVNAMLLNEFLKEHRKVEGQRATIIQLKSDGAKQKATLAELKSAVAQQKKGMEVLTSQLNEQAAQIQKVRAQIEMSRRRPQIVAGDR